VVRLVVTGGWWQLDSKTAKVTSLSPGRGNLANKRAKLQLPTSTTALVYLQINISERTPPYRLDIILSFSNKH